MKTNQQYAAAVKRALAEIEGWTLPEMAERISGCDPNTDGWADALAYLEGEARMERLAMGNPAYHDGRYAIYSSRAVEQRLAILPEASRTT